MTKQQFDYIINNRLETIKNLLLTKGKEYIRNNDMLHNFHRAAEMRRTNSTEALQGMLDKHLVSWLDIVDDVKNNKDINPNILNEKIGDIITYFLLAECTIVEHNQRLIKKKEKNNYKKNKS
jgi:hypothetical protein